MRPNQVGEIVLMRCYCTNWSNMRMPTSALLFCSFNYCVPTCGVHAGSGHPYRYRAYQRTQEDANAAAIISADLHFGMCGNGSGRELQFDTSQSGGALQV